MPIFQTQDNPSATHNHDAVYYTQAAADSAFSAAGHDHDGDYSATTHDHDGDYSATTHDHDSDYLPADAALGDLFDVDETGKTDGQSVVWSAGASKYVLATVTSGGGVTDHGALTGLGDDDHTQYHTDARGDARYSLASHNHDSAYYTETEVNNLLGGYSVTTHNHDSAYSAAAHTHDTRYYTETETDVLLATKSATTHNHSGVYAATSHTHDDRYYTETEMDSALSGKASSTHDHNSASAGSGTAFTWATGWSDISGATPLSVTKVGNVVHINGHVKRNSGTGMSTMIILEPAYRPAYERYATILYKNIGLTEIVLGCQVNTNGYIVLQTTQPTSALSDVYVNFTYPLD